MKWSTKLRNTRFKQCFNDSFKNRDGSMCALTAIYDGSPIEAIKATRMSSQFISKLIQCVICNRISPFLTDYIIHLNDSHKFTFTQIADILDNLDPDEDNIDDTITIPESERELVPA